MPEYVEALKEAGIPVTAPCSYGYKHIAKLAGYVNFLKNTDITRLENAVPDAFGKGTKTALSEHASKELLGTGGIPVPRETVAENEELAVAAAEKLGYPVVMKVESPDILHKTDAGGVKLNLKNAAQVRAAYNEILSNCRTSCPDARINGVLVQEMLKSGTEMIVGVTNDPSFGPMVLCGMGGVFTEVFKDAAVFPAPLTKKNALAMIGSLKAYRIMNGYRGQKKLDVDALADMLVRVGDFAVQHRNDLAEMDMNPVFVYPEGEGAAVADALVIRYQ